MTTTVEAPPGEVPHAEPRAGLAGRRWVQALAAFLVYVAASLLLFGRHVLPHLGTHYLGKAGNPDAPIFMWSLAWMPHALAHGLNPLHSGWVWAPAGFNLAWTTTIPGPALVMAPFTVAFGPIVSFNLLMLAGPALSAFAAYLLCRRFVSFAPALVGGVVYGFCNTMTAQMVPGHPNLILSFAPPLLAYLVVRFVEGSLGRVAFAIWSGVVLLTQFTINTEGFFTLTLWGGLALLIAIIAVRDDVRRRLVSALPWLLAAYVGVGIVMSPFLVTALSHIPKGRLTQSEHYSIDLFSPVVPSETIQLGHGAFASIAPNDKSYDVKQGYVGVFLLAALFAFAVERWRRPEGKLLPLGFLVSVLVALGPILHVARNATIRFPWAGLWRLPIVKNVVPSRFMLYAFLFLAVAVALWLDGAGRFRWVRWTIVALGLALIFPNVSSQPYDLLANRPPFIADRMYERYFRPGDNVAIIPYRHNIALMWQAESNIYFRIPEGYLGPNTPPQRSWHMVRLLYDAEVMPSDAPALLRYYHASGVKGILVEPWAWPIWRKSLLALGFRPQHIGGVVLIVLR